MRQFAGFIWKIIKKPINKSTRVFAYFLTSQIKLISLSHEITLNSLSRTLISH
jgi:hypothetical protein